MSMTVTCKCCGKELDEDARWQFCDDFCAHKWLESKDDWVYIDGMGMWLDLTFDDDNMNNGSLARHYLDEAVQMQLQREEDNENQGVEGTS